MIIQTSNNIEATSVDLDLSDTPSSPQSRLLGVSDTQLTVNPAVSGKQHGHVILPISQRNAAQRQLRIPVCVIRGGEPGPTVTMMAGVHGDEYEGVLTLQSMARDITADSIHGCLILLPSLNPAGLCQGQRNSPWDALDLDLCFPGNPHGSISERLAHVVFEQLIRPADLIVDLRSGGRDLLFAPTAAVRFSTDRKHQAITEAAMIAFGAPNSVRLPPSHPDSCLQAAVQAIGKHYMQSELGGASSVSADTLAISKTGCYNVLRHWGLLHDELELRASRMLEVRDESFYVYSHTQGMLEPQTRLGQEVWQGDVLASVVNTDNTGNSPEPIIVPRNGVLLACNKGGHINAGELLAILADEVQR